MRRYPVLAKFLLGVLVLNGPLCPCAALAAEFDADVTSGAPEITDAGAHEHGAHRNGEPRGGPTADYGAADCASSAPGDCDMAEDRRQDARSKAADRFGDVVPALPSCALRIDAARPIAGARLLSPPAPERLPLSTPIADHDRLLT